MNKQSLAEKSPGIRSTSKYVANAAPSAADIADIATMGTTLADSLLHSVCRLLNRRKLLRLGI